MQSSIIQYVLFLLAVVTAAFTTIGVYYRFVCVTEFVVTDTYSLLHIDEDQFYGSGTCDGALQCESKHLNPKVTLTIFFEGDGQLTEGEIKDWKGTELVVKKNLFSKSWKEEFVAKAILKGLDDELKLVCFCSEHPERPRTDLKYRVIKFVSGD